MRYLQAGEQRLVALEPDQEMLRSLVSQAGFECEIHERSRQIVLDVVPAEGERLLLFDASDPANLGWFARSQFYVDGLSGRVLQTPLTLANHRQGGQVRQDRLRIALSTELPAGFRLPGKQDLSEQVVYALLFNLLAALKENGVAVCGKGSVVPIAAAPKPPTRRSGKTAR